jgi:hypothetical protein
LAAARKGERRREHVPSRPSAVTAGASEDRSHDAIDDGAADSSE